MIAITDDERAAVCEYILADRELIGIYVTLVRLQATIDRKGSRPVKSAVNHSQNIPPAETLICSACHGLIRVLSYRDTGQMVCENCS